MSDQGKRYIKIKTSTFKNFEDFFSIKIMQIYIYISFARFSAKGFSILANISFANLTASVM